MKTIEQLEQERDAYRAAAETLAKYIDAPGLLAPPAVHKAIDAIEALKPEPERLRLWVNVSKDGGVDAYRSKDGAINDASSRDVRHAVPMIEIRPIGEVPTWEEWDAKQVGDELMRSDTDLYQDGETFADRHNAEMRRAFDFINQLLAERGEG